MVIVVGIVALGIGLGLMRLMDKAQIDGLKAQKQLAEYRAKQVIEQATGSEEKIKHIQSGLATLEKAWAGKASAVQPIFEQLVSHTGAVATANTMTKMIATAITGPTKGETHNSF
jgi:hypothetical protein